VANAFFTLAKIESDLRNVQETIALMSSRTKELNDRVRLGKSRESEVLMVESSVSALRAQEQQIIGQRAAALEDLSLLTGVDSSAITIIDDIPLVDAAEPVDTILKQAESRSDIKAIKEDAAAQAHLVRVAKGAFYPTLDFVANWFTSRSGGSLQNVKWDALLSLDFPLYSGGIRRARLSEQESRLREAEDYVSLLALDIRAEVKTLYHSLVYAIAQEKASQDAFQKAEKSYQLQMKEYRLGLVNNLEVLQSLQTLLTTKASLDRSLLQVKQSRVLLDIAAERI
jgi:outer membrane protein TolC